MQAKGYERAINYIHPLVIAMTAVIVGVEVILSLADFGLVGGARGVGWRITAISDYAYSPVILDRVLLGDRSLDMLRHFVTYPFVSGSLTQALFGSALLLALGKFVSDICNGWSVVVIFFFTTVTGALAYGLVMDGPVGLYGPQVPIYGLIGAYSYLMWQKLGREGGNQFKAFRLIAFLLGLQLVYSLTLGRNPAWVAEVGAFAAGFPITVLLAPGGWRGFTDRLRNRSFDD